MKLCSCCIIFWLVNQKSDQNKPVRITRVEVLTLRFDCLNQNLLFRQISTEKKNVLDRARPKRDMFDRARSNWGKFRLSNNKSDPNLNVINYAFRVLFIRMKWIELFAIWMLRKDELFMSYFSIFWSAGLQYPDLLWDNRNFPIVHNFENLNIKWAPRLG